MGAFFTSMTADCRRPAARFDPVRTTLIGKAADFVIGGSIEGDYYEFGVFDGSSLEQACWAFETANRALFEEYGFVMSEEARQWAIDRRARMKFYGFDSFDGLPEIKGIDVGGAFKEGDYSCPQQTVVRRFEEKGIGLEKIELVPGWFSDSLTEDFIRSRNGRQAAVIHIDCDLYESTNDILLRIVPLIQDGTVIIFDDWFQFRGHPMRGEQRAFREFLDRNPQLIATEYQREGVWRNSFILNLR